MSTSLPTSQPRQDPSLAPSLRSGQPTKKRRGGQPGNRNALRHGFYSRNWQKLELDDLDVVSIQGMEDEIALLRVWLRRVTELSNGVEDLDQAINTLMVVGFASQKLAGMLRTHKLLSGGDDGMTNTINSVIDEILKDWGRK